MTVSGADDLMLFRLDLGAMRSASFANAKE